MAVSWIIMLPSAVWMAGGLMLPTLPPGPPGWEEEQKMGGCRGNLPKISTWMQADSSSGFRARPDRSTWMERLQRSVDAGARDPCNADVIAKSVGRTMGFGSRINTLADELLVAVYGGFSLSLCNGTRSCNDGLNRIWAPHFENRAGISSCDSDDSPCNHASFDLLLGVAQLGKSHSLYFKDFDRDYIVDLKRFLYSVIWEISPIMQTRVDAALHDAGLDVTRPYVGVHVRRRDKKSEAKPVPGDVYANAIRQSLEPRSVSSDARVAGSLIDTVRKQLDDGGIDQVLVCSDDRHAVEEIRVALGSHVRIVQPPASDVKTRQYLSEQSVLGVLVAVEGLRRAQTFVGTASSNIGRLVYFLRPKGSKSISMDMGGDWLWAG